MSRWHIEQFEVIQFSFHLRRFEHLKSHSGENSINGPEDLSTDMKTTNIDRPAGKGNVNPLLQVGIPLVLLQCLDPIRISPFQRGLYLVPPLSRQWTLVLRETSNLLKDPGEFALLPEILYPPRIQLR
jgi:hypothetical protein